MKFQKLLVNTGAVCLLLGASCAAMAVDCGKGFIINETVDEINVNTAGNCLISNVVVLGNVDIENGLDVVIRESRVFGRVKIVNSASVGLFDNEVVDGNVIVEAATVAYIAGNILIRKDEQRSLVVRNLSSEGEGVLWNNVVEQGVIRCPNSPNAFARNNIALSVRCVGQINDPF